jgi:hypothetical protein
MNCQHESEHDGQKQAANAEQQPMEILDYLHLASFIHYQHNGAAHAHSPVDAGSRDG